MLWRLRRPRRCDGCGAATAAALRHAAADAACLAAEKIKDMILQFGCCDFCFLQFGCCDFCFFAMGQI
jgi:hypothetical protein